MNDCRLIFTFKAKEAIQTKYKNPLIGSLNNIVKLHYIKSKRHNKTKNIWNANNQDVVKL